MITELKSKRSTISNVGVHPRVEREVLEESSTATGLLRYLIVVAAMIGAVMEVLDTTITNVAIPQMQGNLGATISEVAWVNTGYIVSNVIVLPLTGWLSDRFGRRNYFAASIAIFTSASFFCGMSHTLSALVFWRLVQGLGGGGLLSTGQVILLKAFPKSQQGIATAIFGMGVMVGPSIGPTLGGYLTDNYSWPWIFFVNIPFGIAAVLTTLLYVPGAPSKNARFMKVDIPGIALLAIGMGSLQTVLERGQEEDWYSSRLIITLTAVAVIGLVAFIWHELNTEHPIVNLRALRNRSLAAGTLYSVILGIGLYAMLFLLPLFLQNARGYTATETGLIMMPSALMSMCSFMLAGSLVQRVDGRLLLLFGTCMFLAGTFGYTHLSIDSGADYLFMPLLIRGFSLGFLFIPLTLISLNGLADSDVGTGSGLINLTRQLGGSVGIAIASTTLVQQMNVHRAVLVRHIESCNQSLNVWLIAMQSINEHHGSSMFEAHRDALAQLDQLIEGQSATLAFNDTFLMIFLVFLLGLPLILIFGKPHNNKSQTPST